MRPPGGPFKGSQVLIWRPAGSRSEYFPQTLIQFNLKEILDFNKMQALSPDWEQTILPSPFQRVQALLPCPFQRGVGISPFPLQAVESINSSPLLS